MLHLSWICVLLHQVYSFIDPSSQTDGTSHRQTPGSLSRTPVSLESPDSLDASIHELSSDDDEEQKRKAREPSPWEHSPKRSR